MTTWSGGWGWEPSGADTATSTWGGIDAGVGWPDVIVDNVAVTDRCTGATWSSGRSWWFADPEPGSASVKLNGRLVGTAIAGAAIGDPLAIRADPTGPLWFGWIDSIVETTEPVEGELGYQLSITASDAMSRLLSTELYASLALVAGTLPVRLAALATAAGVPAPNLVTVLPSTGVLPTLVAVTLVGSSSAPLTLGEHLAACERASNAIVAVAKDGSWLILPRARVTETPEVITLDGDSDPNHLEMALASPDRVLNVFTIAGTPEQTYPASVTKYGRRAYDVPAGVAATAPPYFTETFAALAEPAPYASAVIPVATRTAELLTAELFDWCRVSTRPVDEYYQLLAASWRASPDTWEAGVELDRNQLTIAGPPDPETEPPPIIPPSTATVTDTFLCDRSAYVVQTTGGLEAGNGASVDLLVGKLGDGNVARALLRFDLKWRGKVVSVSSAQLHVKGGSTTCSAYGSDPTFRIRRVTESWSAGTYATRCAFASGNAVVWPGPASGSSGEVVKAGPNGAGDLVTLGVIDIVRAWATGSSNYGLTLRGASESSSGNRAPLWSRHASDANDRPKLVVTYTYEV